MGSDAQLRTQCGAAVLALATGLSCLPCDAQTASQSPLLRDFIGMNGHSYDMTPHVDLYTPVTTLVRDYHPMGWDITTTNGDTRFPKGAATNDSWLDWNREYGTWAAAGMRTNMDIQFENFAQTSWSNMAADSYKYGKSVGQYFGATGAGKNLISSVEIGNEPGDYSNANFVTVVKNMSQGIRDYAPTLPIVTCNVKVGSSGAYHKDVNLFRTNNMLNNVDVLATHVYAQLTGWPTWERSYPEDPRLPDYLNSVQALVNWRNQYAPGKQVWVTEFGYDSTTKPNHTDDEFKDEIFVTDVQAARYLTRSYLEFAAMGVDRAYMFYYNDNDEPTLHASSGLTRNWTPKPSYWATKHLQETLGDYRFSETIQETAGSLYIHSYARGDEADDLIWVLWSPTGSDREALYTLSDLPGDVLFAEQMPLAGGNAPLVPYQLLGSGQIQLTVGEAPIYLHMQVPEPTSLALAFTGASLLLRRRTGR